MDISQAAPRERSQPLLLGVLIVFCVVAMYLHTLFVRLRGFFLFLL